MKIKKLYATEKYPNVYVLENLEGEFYKFFISPFRNITEKDLRPVLYYRPWGNMGTEAGDYIYKLYGLEKAE